MRLSLLPLLAAAALLLVSPLGAHATPTPVRREGTCRVLALSGGGDRAAYEVGVLRGLVSTLPSLETQYDVVTGISAGSTLSAALAVFPKGEENGAVDLMVSIVSQLNQSSIFEMWPGGLMEGLMNHSSLFDNTPLERLLLRNLDGRQVTNTRTTCIGASNVGSGKFERFCDFKDAYEVIEATLASVAIPGIFNARTIRGQTYIDGGILMNVDIVGGIHRCMEMGFEQERILVDTVQCGGVPVEEWPGDMSKLTVLPILFRFLNLRESVEKSSHWEAAKAAYPRVGWRYHVFPSQPIPGMSIDFNQTTMRWMQELGTEDAIRAVKGGEIKGTPINLHNIELM